MPVASTSTMSTASSVLDRIPTPSDKSPQLIILDKLHPSDKVFNGYFKGAVPPPPSRWPKVMKRKKYEHIPRLHSDIVDDQQEDETHIGVYMTEYGVTQDPTINFTSGARCETRGVAMSLAINGMGISGSREEDNVFKAWLNARKQGQRKYMKVHLWYPFPGAKTGVVYMRVTNLDGSAFTRGQLAAAVCTLFKEHFDKYVVPCGWAVRPSPHTKPVTFDEFRLLGLTLSTDGSCRIAFGQLHRCTTGDRPCIHNPHLPGELQLLYRARVAAEEQAEREGAKQRRCRSEEHMASKYGTI